MPKSPRSRTIVSAEDDEDDRLMIREALNRTGKPRKICSVNNGEELLNFLYQKGNFNNNSDALRPDLIITDLNMPKKNGIATIREIKLDPKFRNIPIVVLTGSQDEKDIRCCYELGISGYIVKPNTFDELVYMMAGVDQYWLELVRQPQYE